MPFWIVLAFWNISKLSWRQCSKKKSPKKSTQSLSYQYEPIDWSWSLPLSHMGLSENRGYPQIAILMGNHWNMVIIHWNMRYTIFRQTHILGKPWLGSTILESLAIDMDMSQPDPTSTKHDNLFQSILTFVLSLILGWSYLDGPILVPQCLEPFSYPLVN